MSGGGSGTGEDVGPEGRNGKATTPEPATRITITAPTPNRMVARKSMGSKPPRRHLAAQAAAAGLSLPEEPQATRKRVASDNDEENTAVSAASKHFKSLLDGDGEEDPPSTVVGRFRDPMMNGVRGDGSTGLSGEETLHAKIQTKPKPRSLPTSNATTPDPSSTLALRPTTRRSSSGGSVVLEPPLASPVAAEERSTTAPPQAAPLILVDHHDLGDPSTIEERIREHIETELGEKSYFRKIAGPALPDEFDSSIQDHMRKAERIWYSVNGDDMPYAEPQHTFIFQQMVDDCIESEVPPPTRKPTCVNPDPYVRRRPPSVTIIPDPARDKYAPDFEFYYTNRVVYAPGIPPIQSPGCDCEGDCNDAVNRKTCACLKRQIAACASTPGDASHTGHNDFAYNRHGRIHEAILEAQEPVWECNSECGCPPSCINRHVGNKEGIDVEIFQSEACGWGVRLPATARRVQKGAVLGIYAGELGHAEKMHARDDVYNVLKRTYLYDLDNWTIKRHQLAQNPRKAKPAAIVRKAQPAVAFSQTSPHSKSSKRKKTRKLANVAAEEEQEEEDWDCPYALDAFSYGNWTRMCNHHCQSPNAASFSVYVDEGAISRPLDVYVAIADIKPGDEIFISYYSSDKSPSVYTDDDGRDMVHDVGRVGVDLALEDYVDAADKARNEANEWEKCYCGALLCRGMMFAQMNIVPAEEACEDGDAEELEGRV